MLHVINGNMPEDFKKLAGMLARIETKDLPIFEEYRENIDAIRLKIGRVKKKKLVLLANGGSNTSFLAYYKALLPLDRHKDVYILTSQEPDLINEVKRNFSLEDTLVMIISKSGTNVGPLESLFAFLGYEIMAVTEPEKGALSKIAASRGMNILKHPPVGGRYSGLTASAYAPALFFGLDVDQIEEGARNMYDRCRPNIAINQNPALRLSAQLYMIEHEGYSEIFCPIYSFQLSGFANLIVQLMHESVCKEGKGQVIYCAEAPESQHHTNQRFFGGQKNVCGLFIRIGEQADKESKIAVPQELHAVPIRDGTLKDLQVPYAKAFEFEFRGTYQDALNNKIPVSEIVLEKLTPYSVGQLVGLWHYMAVYSSWLRGVDPFNQPQVESSKAISFELTKKE